MDIRHSVKNWNRSRCSRSQDSPWFLNRMHNHGMNAEPPFARFQMERQPRRPGYAERYVANPRRHGKLNLLLRTAGICSIRDLHRTSNPQQQTRPHRHTESVRNCHNCTRTNRNTDCFHGCKHVAALPHNQRMNRSRQRLFCFHCLSSARLSLTFTDAEHLLFGGGRVGWAAIRSR